jgi:PAS domain S-box-containing protein
MVILNAKLSPYLLIQWLPVFHEIGLNSALCFLLAGFGLLLPKTWLLGKRVIGILLIAISTLVILQISLNLMVDSKVWWLIFNPPEFPEFPPGNWAGRMGILDALAFLASGLALVTLYRYQSLAAGFIALGMIALVLMMATIGLLSHLVSLSLRLPVDIDCSSGLVCLPSTYGLLIFSLGLCSECRHHTWIESYYWGRKDRQIALTSVVFLLIIDVLAGLIGMSISTNQFNSLSSIATKDLQIILVATTLFFVLVAVVGALIFSWLIHPLARELTAIQKRQTSILNATSDGIIGLDFEDRIIFINSAAAKLLDQEKAELKGQKIQDFLTLDISPGTSIVPDSESAAANQPTEQHRKTQEITLDRKGVPLVLECYCSPLVEAEIITGTVLILHDVTERHAYEERLIKSETDLARAQRLAHIGFWDLDIILDRLVWSAETYRIFGIEGGKPVVNYQSFLNLVHTNDREYVKSAVKRTLKTGEPYEIDLRIVLPEGSERIVHSQGEASFDQRGRAVRFFGTVQDITERKKLELRLAEKEATFKAIATNTPGMIFQLLRTTEGTLRFLYVSEGSLELCEIPAEEILQNAQVFWNQIYRDDQGRLFTELGYSALNRKPLYWEGRIQPPSQKWISLRATPQLQENGGILWSGIALNVTQSKQSVEQIRSSHQQIRELAAHLQAAREEERKHIAREIHDELGLSLAVLKMDLSDIQQYLTPIAPVLLEKIGRMRALIDRTVTNMRAISTELRPAVLDLGLGVAIEWLCEQFKNRHEMACHLSMNELELALENDERSIAIFRILQESLTNIVRHARASQVEIILEKREDYLWIQVRDNGIGINENDLSKTHSYGLLGMKERVLFLGGELNIHGRPGIGTTLTASIPLTDKTDPK